MKRHTYSKTLINNILPVDRNSIVALMPVFFELAYRLWIRA
jgi:hypothetical protein